jgi:hypothetical protein
MNVLTSWRAPWEVIHGLLSTVGGLAVKPSPQGLRCVENISIMPSIWLNPFALTAF